MIREINTEAAVAVPGVLDILTFKNAGQVRPLKTFSDGGQSGSSIVPLSSPKIWHDGQIVALVVAETFEAASEAADKVIVHYDEEIPNATLDSPGTEKKAVADVGKKLSSRWKSRVKSQRKATSRRTDGIIRPAATKAASVYQTAGWGSPSSHANKIYELAQTTTQAFQVQGLKGNGGHRLRHPLATG